MRVTLDTNRITDLFRGDADLAGMLEEFEEVWLPLIALGESKPVLQGVRRKAEMKRC